jgi:hypothetical protein
MPRRTVPRELRRLDGPRPGSSRSKTANPRRSQRGTRLPDASGRNGARAFRLRGQVEHSRLLPNDSGGPPMPWTHHPGGGSSSFRPARVIPSAGAWSDDHAAYVKSSGREEAMQTAHLETYSHPPIIETPGDRSLSGSSARFQSRRMFLMRLSAVGTASARLRGSTLPRGGPTRAGRSRRALRTRR